MRLASGGWLWVGFISNQVLWQNAKQGRKQSELSLKYMKNWIWPGIPMWGENIVIKLLDMVLAKWRSSMAPICRIELWCFFFSLSFFGYIMLITWSCVNRFWTWLITHIICTEWPFYMQFLFSLLLWAQKLLVPHFFLLSSMPQKIGK